MVEKIVRTAIGKVVSDRMDKTIVVLIERRVRHPIYGKFITKSSKLFVHDKNNECVIGDEVIICESRPYSKHKAWKLLNINWFIYQLVYISLNINGVIGWFKHNHI